MRTEWFQVGVMAYGPHTHFSRPYPVCLNALPSNHDIAFHCNFMLPQIEKKECSGHIRSIPLDAHPV